MAGNGGKGTAAIQVGVLYGGSITLDTIFMIFDEEGDGMGADQELGRGVVWNDAVLVVEL